MLGNEDLLQFSAGNGAAFPTVAKLAAAVSTQIGDAIPHTRVLPPRAPGEMVLSTGVSEPGALLPQLEHIPNGTERSADPQQSGPLWIRSVIDRAQKCRVSAEPFIERIKGIAKEIRTYAAECAESSAWMKQDGRLRLVRQLFLDGERHARVVVFCGPEGGVGCSTICAQLAFLLARQTSGTVCLVHADTRSEAMQDASGMRTRKGIAEAVLYHGEGRDSSAQLEHLWIMTAGAFTTDGHVHVASKSLRQCVKRLRDSFDFVLIDAPPLDTCTDAAKLGLLTDGVVMVMGANSTRRDVACKTADLLRSAKVKLLAAVLSSGAPPAMLGIDGKAD